LNYRLDADAGNLRWTIPWRQPDLQLRVNWVKLHRDGDRFGELRNLLAASEPDLICQTLVYDLICDKTLEFVGL